MKTFEPVRLLQVDSFTSEPYKGNPAAVCVLEAGDPRADNAAWMQNVALEMNLAETAFVARRADGRLDLRWFTPTTEAELCGHATLAAAHALWTAGVIADGREIAFHSQAGILNAAREGTEIRLDFPLLKQDPIATPAGLERALGAVPLYVGENPFRLLVELDSEATVRGLKPNISALKEFSRDISVSARSSTSEFDFVSRYFAPACGIDEDPVTGSAHCLLAPYWGKKLGKSELVGFQASARGGKVRARIAGERVLLFGNAVTVARIELLH